MICSNYYFLTGERLLGKQKEAIYKTHEFDVYRTILDMLCPNICSIYSYNHLMILLLGL